MGNDKGYYPLDYSSTTFTSRAYDYCPCPHFFFVHMTKSA